MNVPQLITQQRGKMIDVLSILAEPIHKKAKIPNMLCRYNIFAAYVDGNIINFFELLMCSKKENELSFSIIQLQHIHGHPILDLFNTSLHLMNAVILS